ncbi:MAG: hypothetical protein H0T46_34440 [Deltaproteobacteria bacterium]|nr:hypothetical protein [Deltaproteobacteria bacterium]
MRTTLLVCTAALLGGCAMDEELTLSETRDEVVSTNRLAVNRLAVNRLAVNRLAVNRLAVNSLEAQDLMSTEEGRDVMAYIVGCALRTGETVTLQDTAGTQYTMAGWIGLAPAWATRAPTVSERRWVTACILARTNVNGVPVHISMRHDSNLALLTTAAERTQYSQVEGAFYGDLFASTSVWYACSNRGWTTLSPGTFRACALSPNGITTDCGFTYTGACTNTTTCADKTAPFGGCKAGGLTYNEVITINLTPTQQAGGTQ